MFPRRYLDEFRTFYRSDRVFVAMPMSPAFEQRWRRLFRPAIVRVGLEPWRADMRKSGDSIQTEILKEIGQAKLILVDISTDSRNCRNANVMYELGLAHAARLPEEVIIVRTDTRPLPFDFTQIRVHQLDPANPSRARAVVESLLRDALSEIDLTRDLLVARTMRSLDEDARYVIAMEYDKTAFGPYQATDGRYGHLSWQELRTILRQLQMLGLIDVDARGPAEPSRYVWSDLGRAVIARLRAEFPRFGA